MKNTADKIKAVLEHFGITQTKFAESIGMKHTAVINWQSGKTQMPQSTKLAIQAVYGIRWQWWTQDGVMLLKDRPKLTDQERDLLDAFQKLPKKRQEFIVGFTQAAALEEAKSRDS